MNSYVHGLYIHDENKYTILNSELLLFNAKQAIFQLCISWREQVNFNEIMMMSALS